MDLKLTGKRVLVTGGNSGLGAAMVRAFATEHARVAINYLVHPEQTAQLAGELRAGGAEVLELVADVAQANDVAAMFQKIDGAWGGLDVLVNNAGIDGARAMAWEADVAAWNRVLQINLGGAFQCAREALKRMVPQRSGVIINTSSVHEMIAWSGYSAYCASKAGLSMMSKTLAQEAGAHGVRVLCVAPGGDSHSDQRRGLAGPGRAAGLDQQDRDRSGRRAAGCGRHGGGAGFRCGRLRDR